MKKSVVITVFAIALVGLLYIAFLEDSAIVAVTELGNDPEIRATEQTTIEATVESLRDIQSDTPSSGLAPIVINWRESPDRSFPFPNGSPIENYHYFRSLAESGNGFAAYRLAEMMSNCRHSFSSQEELDRAIAQLRRTFTYYDSVYDANVHLATQEKVEEYISGRIHMFERCKHFSAEQREEHEKWLELAVNNGYTLAMLEYGRKLDDPVAAVELYRSAWRQGNGEALLSLAQGLEQIYDEGIDPAAKIPAYAAMHAFVTLLRVRYGADPGRVTGRRTLRNQAKLDEMAQEMLPHELEAAEAQSRQLITSNGNCCLAM